MKSLQCSIVFRSICVGLTATSLHARELQQPASVAPWQARPAAAKLLLSDPVTSVRSDAPAWLLDVSEPVPKRTNSQEELPMVEAESFAHLGSLEADSEGSFGRSAGRNRVGPSRISQPVNLLPALGNSLQPRWLRTLTQSDFQLDRQPPLQTHR